MKVTDEMVDRFLSWRLPITAMPDACVMDRSHDRTGTNVLSFTEAKAMLEHILAGCDENKSVPSDAEREQIKNDVLAFAAAICERVASDSPATRAGANLCMRRIRARMTAAPEVHKPNCSQHNQGEKP